VASLATAIEGLNRLPGRQQFGTILGLAVVVSLAIAAWMWGQSPDYRVLYTNLSDRDGGAIIAALNQMNVPYKLSDAGGAIMVPSTNVHDARLRLASQGLPKGSVVGFELMEQQRIGVTQFQEQVNYQRALEGELAKSIQSLSAVQAARVHLAIPKSSVFMREQQKPTASVLLNLYPGQTLERAQISGIVHLVASSVPELTTKNVSVLGQTGDLLSAQTQAADGSMLDATQLQYLRQVETSYINRILAILEPVVGRDNVRAQVTADVDFTSTEQMAELYKPNAKQDDTSIRSQQTTEALSGSGPLTAQGVPGALSNQPAAAATAPLGTQPTPVQPNANNTPARGAAPAAAPPAGAQASAAAPQNGNLRRETTTNFEVDKTIRHTRNPTGAIRRISAAVVVNSKRSINDNGETVVTPRTEKEMAQISALVHDAIGFSKERGDALNVANAPFSITEEVVEPIPLWKQPETLSIAKDVGKYLLLGVIGFFLVASVIRPLLRHLTEVKPPPPEDPNQQHQQLLSSVDKSADLITQARQIAQQDPRVVASVVRGWVNKDG
jgi:flagellar M-ring protein FliF